VVPLSTSLDSIGPLANSVECCAIVDAVFAGEPIAVPEPMPLGGLRLAVPRHYVMDELDATVAKAFERALKALAAKGVKVEHIDLPQLNELPTVNAKGGFAPRILRLAPRASPRGNEYDPLVAPRIRRGAEMSAADYIELLGKRADLQKRVSAITSNYDAVAMPSCAIVAPTLEEVSTPEGFTRKNMLLLRNTTVGNFLDRCSISLPCHAQGELPVGFMLMGEAMADQRVLAMARQPVVVRPLPCSSTFTDTADLSGRRMRQTFSVVVYSLYTAGHSIEGERSMRYPDDAVVDMHAHHLAETRLSHASPRGPSTGSSMVRQYRHSSATGDSDLAAL
jgi:Asp-tRNA(Asn)/Glu-tRNA(Gln) amidotransferase A subunit family amidase